MADHTLPLRRRVARLSALAVLLFGLSLILLALAVWVALRAEPNMTVGHLPVGLADAFPSLPFVLAAGAAAAGLFVGMAALYAAAAMRVLARDRRIPPPLSPPLRATRSYIAIMRWRT